MSRRIIGPFNRVEGDLEVRLDIRGSKVEDAFVVSPMYRGFEQILHGKDPRDALVIVPRICGICSVSQSAAAAAALGSAAGISVPRNGQLASNLILAAENVADHLTHFYVFFMPDFARPIYGARDWSGQIAQRFKAVEGTASRDMLPARAQFLHIVGLLAGKWPHTLAIQPGGSTKSVAVHEKARLIALLGSFRRFLETVLFGDKLETISQLKSTGELSRWAEQQDPHTSDFASFLHLAHDLHLHKLGRATDRFLSYGAYRLDDDHAFAQGVFMNGAVAPFNHDDIREDHTHAWMAHSNRPRHPFDGVTVPDADAHDGYSWCKAPRLSGNAVEVGALARQVVDGHPLARDLVKASGGNVKSRVVARLLEIAIIIPLMQDWARALEPGGTYCVQGRVPEEAESFGLVEAARGALGHWLKIRNGRILNYQVIAPTTWNFSPRDAQGTPGALEQALKGAPVLDGEKDPVSVQHIVRSFDPCMVCTAH